MTTTEQLHAAASQLASEASAAAARRIAADDTVRHLVNERDRLQGVIAQATSDLGVIQDDLDVAEVEQEKAERDEKQARTCAVHVATEAATA